MGSFTTILTFGISKTRVGKFLNIGGGALVSGHDEADLKIMIHDPVALSTALGTYTVCGDANKK